MHFAPNMCRKSSAKRNTKFVMKGFLSSSIIPVCEHLHLVITDLSLLEFGCVLLSVSYIVLQSLRNDAKVYSFFLPD